MSHSEFSCGQNKTLYLNLDYLFNLVSTIFALIHLRWLPCYPSSIPNVFPVHLRPLVSPHHPWSIFLLSLLLDSFQSSLRPILNYHYHWEYFLNTVWDYSSYFTPPPFWTVLPYIQVYLMHLVLYTYSCTCIYVMHTKTLFLHYLYPHWHASIMGTLSVLFPTRAGT